jgi:putative phosphoesterase
MTRIGVLSDTHSFLDPLLIPVLSECDEIWHAGDIGNRGVLLELEKLGKRIRVVYGNIDGHDIRIDTPKHLIWHVEKRKVLMTHIGGYPGRYTTEVKQMLLREKPDIYVCGHSHILKVIYDKSLNLLHINPGACGREGFQQVRTMIQFVIDNDQIKDMAIVEL